MRSKEHEQLSYTALAMALLYFVALLFFIVGRSETALLVCLLGAFISIDILRREIMP